MGGRGVRLKYLHAFRDRTGTLRFYFRRNGIRTRLPGSFGSREFLDAYAAASGEQTAEPAERKGTRLIPRAGNALLCIAAIPVPVGNESDQLSARH